MKKRSAEHLDSAESFDEDFGEMEVPVVEANSAPVTKGQNSRLRTPLPNRTGEITGVGKSSGPPSKKRNIPNKERGRRNERGGACHLRRLR